MPSACRPLPALAAVAVIGVAIALAARGIRRTPVPGAPPGAGAPLLGPRVRAWYRGLLEPMERQLVAWRIHPDALTWSQLVVSALAGGAFAAGWIFVAGWLTIIAGSLDVLDGGVARRMGIAGPRGALIDSLVDRYAEFVTYLGLGAFFRQSWLLLVVAVTAFASLMVSYTRARAEGLGVAMAEGSAQRPERYVVLGLGAMLSGIVAHLACALGRSPTQGVLGLAVLVLGGLAAWTAVQRAWHAVRALERGRAA